jgi:SAM-dependent methyltransferase
MYYDLAHLYDWPGARDFTEKAQERDLAIMTAAGFPPPASVIDLACGTGTQALALARLGYEVLGIDLSPAMLSIARKKQANESVGVSVQWQEADMRTFLVDRLVDVALCHHDSLNHLSNETELRATFLQVAQALKSGGLFLFDLNTLENFETFWNGSDTYEGENYRLRTTASFNPDNHKAEVLFEVDEYLDDGTLISRSERVCEQYFHEAAVEKYLRAAGFQEIQWEPFSPVDAIPSDLPLKSFWQARV